MNIHWRKHAIRKNDRAKLNKQKPCILWFTGLSGSGKSTIADELEIYLHNLGCRTYLLDGDNIRHGLCKDLTFDDKDRTENIRRIGEVAKLFVDAGLIVLTAIISPYRKERDQVRKQVEDGEFIEIFVDTPMEICELRDPKGLYKKARSGEIKHFTGIHSEYQAPENPDIIIKTEGINVARNVQEIITYMIYKNIISVENLIDPPGTI